jgi:hypothetical protein
VTQPVLFAVEDGEHSAVTEAGFATLNTCEIGNISEIKFEIEATMRGWIVASPRGRARDFDCIVKRQSTRPVTVQVKKARKSGGLGYVVNTTRALGKTGRRVTYSSAAFDIMAVHLHDIDKWVFYTRHELGDRQSTSYLLPQHRYRSTRQSAPDARDPDNWELLDQAAAMYSQESSGPAPANVPCPTVQMSTSA